MFDKYCYVTARHLSRFFEYRTHLTYSKIERVNSYGEIEYPLICNAIEMLDMHELCLAYDAEPPRSLWSGDEFVLRGRHAEHVLRAEGQVCGQEEAGGRGNPSEVRPLRRGRRVVGLDCGQLWGLNRIDFGPGGYQIRPVIIPPERKAQLNRSHLPFFTGFVRFSVEIQEANASSDSEKRAVLREMFALVDGAEKALADRAGNRDGFGRLLVWNGQRGAYYGLGTGQWQDAEFVLLFQ